MNEELTELPKYWVVKNDGSQLFKDTVIKYMKDNYGSKLDGNRKNYYYGYGNPTGGVDYCLCIYSFDNNLTLLTLEQFIKLTKMEDKKKQIGWKLKEEFKKFEKQAANIAFDDTTINIFTDNYKEYCNFKINSNCEVRLKNAKLLDLWFEPVYEPEKPKEEIVSMNEQFNLRVTKDGIFYGNENITEYVTNVVDFANSIPTKFGKYDFLYSEMKLSKTGCECKETRLSDWINVWKKYKEIQL
ncbi:MAG: hypothetical protein JST04_00945 [Bdellovibrionales bacterium]|nr:hypothetical protein [Bdellovibrionales bacterium]